MSKKPQLHLVILLTICLKLFCFPHHSLAEVAIVFLGTGTPIPDPKHSGPCLAILINGSPYLVDSGIGCVRKAVEARKLTLKRAGQLSKKQPLDIQALKEVGEALAPVHFTKAFITHLHSDHTLGLADLLFTPWVSGVSGHRAVPLELYGPPGLAKMAQMLHDAYDEDIRIRIQGAEKGNPTGHQVLVHEFQNEFEYRDERVQVTPFHVTHGDWNSKAYGYRFWIPNTNAQPKSKSGISIVISGDTSARPIQNKLGSQLMPPTALACQNCDILIHEVYPASFLNGKNLEERRYWETFHTSTQELAKIANQSKPKLLILYHQLYFGVTDEHLIKEIRTAGYAGQVISSRDFMLVLAKPSRAQSPETNPFEVFF